ncbi:MAG: hypothetical protein JWN40_3976 [Phycisphaerales bacterium]|nr:hypothetical protein [Phycisphaerales bacterium]
MSANPPDPNDLKLLPPVGEAGRPPAPNPAGGASEASPTPTPAAAVIAISPSAPRQLADLPKDELATLAEEFGLEPRRYKTPQDLVSAIHGRRQLIASLDRDAMVDVVRWGRRPVPINATNEQLAHEIWRIKSMRFDGLSERGLIALSRLRGVEIAAGEPIPAMVKKLKKSEGFFARMNRKRRAVLGSIVSNMIGENDPAAEYQFLPPVEGRGGPGPTTTTASAAPGARDRSIKEEIEESGLFGGIASRVKKTADQYINQKLDEIESRIDRKLDEIDRRLAEWRDKEIANRLRILKITLWASVIVASLSLIYSYVKVNFYDKPGNAATMPTAKK